MTRLERGPWLTAVLAGALLLLAGCGAGNRSAKQNSVEHDKTHSMRMAKSLFDGGRVSEALTALEEGIERFPDDPTLHHTYGLYCLRAARHAQALAAFRRALELDPYLTDAHNGLGVVHTELAQFMEAEREFKTALEDPAYPTPEKVYLNLGQLYAQQGRNEEAITSLRKAVGIDPKYFKAHFQLASLLDRVGELLEAAREYEVAEPAYRGDGEYWYRRGLAYHRLGEKDKARDSLLRVRSIAPGRESAARAEELLAVLD